MPKKTPVNVAVIGAGAIGLHHIEGFRAHPDARVVALAETGAARGREAADRYNIPALVTDYRDLLRRPDIDIISIALPTWLHAEVSIDALRAGKHVMLDKPMTTNAADAARILAAARKAGRQFMVGQNQRFTGAAQAVKQAVQAGKLGDVYHARGVWLRRAGIPRIGSWFTQKEFAGGGCTYDIGVHVLDLALHLMDDFEPATVSGRTAAMFGPRGMGDGSWGKSEIDPRRPFDVEDFCVAFIRMKSGRTVQLEVSWAAAMEQNDVNGVQLYGSEGGATTNPARLFRNGREGYEAIDLKPTTALASDNRMAHFVDVVLGRAKPFVKPEQSLVVQRVLDAIYTSARTGREVRMR